MSATPMTPWATVRMVAADSLMNPGARSGLMRRAKIARLAFAPDSPYAMITPAMQNEAMNFRIAPPMLATKARADFATPPILGCRLSMNAGRSVYACVQIP
jgi:hypothetical protein